MVAGTRTGAVAEKQSFSIKSMSKAPAPFDDSRRDALEEGCRRYGPCPDLTPDSRQGQYHYSIYRKMVRSILRWTKFLGPLSGDRFAEGCMPSCRVLGDIDFHHEGIAHEEKPFRSVTCFLAASYIKQGHRGMQRGRVGLGAAHLPATVDGKGGRSRIHLRTKFL